MSGEELTNDEEVGYVLTELLETVHFIIMSGKDIDHFYLREACFQCLRDAQAAPRIKCLSAGWPKWTHEALAEAIIMKGARDSGDNRSFVAIMMEKKLQPPLPGDVPLEAWNCLRCWLSEGGPSSGVPLPHWVWQYLMSCANSIQQLRSDVILQKTSPVAAVQAIPRSLQFVKSTWNAFYHDSSQERADTAHVNELNLRSSGRKWSYIADTLQDFFGDDDLRTTTKRLAAGRARNKAPTRRN